MTDIEELIRLVDSELRRLEAQVVKARLDRQFEPPSGTLLRIQYDGADWHLFPHDFLAAVHELPDGAGPEAIKVAIESQVVQIWHGPAPRGSRDAL